LFETGRQAFGQSGPIRRATVECDSSWHVKLLESNDFSCSRRSSNIQPATGARDVLSFIGPSQAYIAIDGVIVDCVNASTECVSIRDGAHHIKIENTELKNSPGIGLVGGADSEFSNLKIHHHKRQGFYSNQRNNVIHHSPIYDSGAMALK
jgi:hypothetical protein